MPVQKNRAVYRRLYEEAYGAGNFAVIDELIAPYYSGHAGNIHGREALKDLIIIFRGAFPDLQVTVEDQLVSGNKVVNRWVARGTHQGPFLGALATGKPIVIEGISIGRIEHGQVTEEWCQWQSLGLLLQLGLSSGFNLNGRIRGARSVPPDADSPVAA
jgi:predicted ester cyclase